MPQAVLDAEGRPRIALLARHAWLATSARRRDPVFWTVAGATALALGLALYRLGTLSLWVDEGQTYSVSQRSWIDVARYVLHIEPNFGLYYVGLRGWAALVGTSEAALRLPSALFAAATVPVTAVLANRLAGRRAAVVAAVLTAVHAALLHWGQEARAYTMVVFFATLSALLLLRACDRPSLGRWTAWVAVAILACYAHTFGAVAVAAQAGARLIRGSPRRPLLMAGGAVAAAAVPVVVLTLASGTSRIGWIPDPNWHYVSFVLKELTGSAGAVLALAYGAAALAGIAVLRGADRILVASWCALPFLFALIASLVQPLFLDRYLLVCIPPLVIASAAGLARVRRTALLAGIVAGFFALSMTAVADWYSGSEREDWRAAVHRVESGERQGDAILVADGHSAFEYYYLRVPGPHAQVLAIGAQGAAAQLRHANRVWLVVRGNRQTDRLGRRLAAAGGRRITGRWRPTLLEVDLYAHS